MTHPVSSALRRRIVRGTSEARYAARYMASATRRRAERRMRARQFRDFVIWAIGAVVIAFGPAVIATLAKGG